MVTGELAPYVDTGTGNVVAALAKGLRQLGHDVTIAMPRLAALEASGLLLSRRLTPLELSDGGEALVFDCQLPSGVKLCAFDGGASLYADPEPFAADTDPDLLAERVGLVVKATHALCEQRAKADQAFDVVHLMDWIPAPVALTGACSRVVLTITDATAQGSFPARSSDVLGIPKDRAGEARAGNRVNALKAGISGADVITTVSDAYARELCTDGHAGGLTRALLDRAEAFVGVQLGVDYALFNPATDPALAHRYDAEDAGGKHVCKTALLRQLELPLDPDRPLITFAGPLTRAAGADWLVTAIPKILANDLVLVVPDVGDEALVAKLLTLSERYPDQLKLMPDYAAATSASHQARGRCLEEKRKLLAASDMWLICPRAEHTGYELMLAQRYGAVPIVHAIGALEDSVVNADAELATGTGFAFDDGSPKALTAAVARAISAYRKGRWSALRRRVMRLDVSWDRPARRFQQLYRG